MHTSYSKYTLLQISEPERLHYNVNMEEPVLKVLSNKSTNNGGDTKTMGIGQVL